MDILQLPKEESITENKYYIAIIIPHRNRIDHLIRFKSHMDSMNKLLNGNQYDIYLIDQNNADKFNRGFLLNMGYLIAKKHKSYDRYIFHDVDSYPDEELFKLYFKYINLNIHYASPYLGYKYTNYTFFGGVIGFNRNDFEKINGFSNIFFGWGGEDDSLFNRCVINNIQIYRPSKGSYILVDHNPPTQSENNISKQQNILDDIKNYQSDGIKQLLNFFINIKKYHFDDFITNYDKIDRNHSNGSESIQSYIESSNISNVIQYNIYKVDYLALHSYNYDKFLDKNYVNKKIQKKILSLNGQKYYQHNKHKEIISFIEPLIYHNEIKTKIFDTYTDLRPFILKTNPTLNKEKKVFNIVEHFFTKYQTRTKEDLFKTIKFIFDTYNELLYIKVRNNKIECAYHLYNLENKFDFLKNVKYINKQKQHQNIDEALVNIMNSRHRDYYTLRKPHYLPTANCLMGFDSYNYYEGNPLSYVKEFIEMIQFTIDYFKDVPDCDILINRKDFPFLRTDKRYAYEHLIKDTETIKDIDKFYFLASQSARDINLDIPVPSADEWKDLNNFKSIINIKWTDKKPIAFFRGSGTGCGTSIKTNPRYLLADISNKWKNIPDRSNLIDVALSKLVSRIKVYDQFIGIDPIKEYRYLVGSFVSLEDQLRYKYIFNIQGNAQAYRYPNEFKKGSLILNVESEYHMWFESILIDNKHIINIKSDYSNLYEKLIYLKTNDIIAKKIAENGYKFSKRYINKKMIATYWLYYMYNINKKTTK